MPSDEELLEVLEAAELEELTPAWVILAIFMVSGFLGNVLVVVVYGWRFKPSSTRSFILALAGFDLVTTGICMPLEMVSLHHLYTFHWPWLCRFVRYLSASVLASFTVLALISVDRCRRIWRSGRQFTLATVTKMLIIITVATFIFMIPSLVVNGINTFHVDENSHYALEKYHYSKDKTTADALRLVADDPFPDNLTGRRCNANDEFSGSTFYKLYIGLILLVGVVDAVILMAMYGAIGVKAFRVINRDKVTSVRTPSSEVSNPAVDLEPHDFSNNAARDAETSGGGDVTSGIQGNGERRTLHRCLSEDRRRPKRKNSAHQRRHVSAKPLLLSSEVEESLPRSRTESSRSRSWPRRKDTKTRKFVQDLSRILQGEVFQEDVGQTEKKHARSRSLGYVFHSMKLQEPPQIHSRKGEPSTLNIAMKEDREKRLSAKPRQCITSQAEGTRSSAELDRSDRGVSDSPGENVTKQGDSLVHELNAEPSRAEHITFHESSCPEDCSTYEESRVDGVEPGPDGDQAARRPSSLGQELQRGRLRRLRYTTRRAEGMRTTLMLFLVTLTFLLSGLPYLVVKAMELAQPQLLTNLHSSNLVLYQLALRSYFLQSAVNPILYSVCVPHFRSQCRRLVALLRTCRS